MRETATTIGEIVGAGLSIAGITMLYGVAAGLIVTGVVVIAICWLLGR